jgi:integrase/recombinase XerD
MFTQFVKTSRALKRYRNGPFAQERQQFLTYLGQRGYRKSRLTGISILLLAIAQRLQISIRKRVTKAEVCAAAEIWMKERRQRSSLPHTLVGSGSRRLRASYPGDQLVRTPDVQWAGLRN